MSRTELDLPVLASPEQIRRREFVTTRRGYDPDQVRNYLEQIARQVEQMESLVRDARLEAEASVATQTPKADPYEQLAGRVAGLIRAAEAEADRIRRDSMEEAERAVREARADADRIRLDSQAKAEEAREAADRALREAREKADRTIAGLDTRRAALMDQLATMQERLLGVAKELEAAIDRRDETVTIESAEAPGESAGRPDAETVEPERTAADAAYEELWAGTEAVDLTIPDIPPLDLGWDDEADG